jgi:hypothetical protein
LFSLAFKKTETQRGAMIYMGKSAVRLYLLQLTLGPFCDPVVLLTDYVLQGKVQGLVGTLRTHDTLPLLTVSPCTFQQCYRIICFICNDFILHSN